MILRLSSIDPIQGCALIPALGTVAMVTCIALKVFTQAVNLSIPFLDRYSICQLWVYSIPIIGTVRVIYERIFDASAVCKNFTKDGMPIMDPDVAATLYRMLKEFDEVCLEMGIQFMACSGTALGALRQKPPGIIPWDDDIDLVLPVSEEQKFDEHFHEALKQRGLKLVAHWGGYKLSMLKCLDFGVTYGEGQSQFFWPFIDVFKTFLDSKDNRLYIDCRGHPELDPVVASTVWPRESWTREDFMSAKRVPFGPHEIPLMDDVRSYCIRAYGKECLTTGRQMFDHKNGRPFAFPRKKRLTDFSPAPFTDSIWNQSLV